MRNFSGYFTVLLISSTQKGNKAFGSASVIWESLGESPGTFLCPFPVLDALCHPDVGCGQTGLAAVQWDSQLSPAEMMKRRGHTLGASQGGLSEIPA